MGRGHDIIIDDGDHLPESQIFVVRNYLSKVKPGDSLVIEDVADAKTIPELMAAVPEFLRGHAQVIDLRQKHGRADDMLFVVHVPEQRGGAPS